MYNQAYIYSHVVNQIVYINYSTSSNRRLEYHRLLSIYNRSRIDNSFNNTFF